MERLTYNGDFCDIANCLELCGGKHCPDGYCSQRRVWERLKKYEDTGIEPESLTRVFNEESVLILAAQLLHTTPDRLRELAQAEQAGRMVVLPCKVGDTVWFDTYAQNATAWLGVRPHKVSRFDISAVVPGAHTDTDLPLYEFGKSVFLTREEAEAALEERAE